MRIFFIHQFYRTPEEGGGIRSWYVTRALQEAGHEVTIVAAEQIQNTKYESEGDREDEILNTKYELEGDREEEILNTKYESEGDREDEILNTKYELEGDREDEILNTKYESEGDREEEILNTKYELEGDREDEILNTKYELEGDREEEILNTKYELEGDREDEILNTKYELEGDREEEILNTKYELEGASDLNDEDRLRNASDLNDEDRLRNASAITVIRLPVGWSNSMSFWQRIKAFVKFLYLARKESKKHEYDMVYAVSVPLTSGLLALWTKKPFVFEVGDLWPDVPVQMRILRNPLIKYFSYRLEKKIYKKAELIISLSKDIQSHIYQKWPFTAHIVVENFSDSSFYKGKNSQRFSKQLESGYTLDDQLQSSPLKLLRSGITNYEIQNIKSSEIICSYVGTAGLANDLMQMVELAKQAEKNFPQIQFYMMISGKEEEIIKKAALSNMHFIDYGNKQKVAELLAISDFNFVTYAQYPLLGTGSPNKFFDGLSSGCITIINVKGWIEELILKENAGLFWDVKNNETLLQTILEIHTNKEQLISMQKHAEDLARQFDQEKLSQKILEQIELRF